MAAFSSQKDNYQMGNVAWLVCRRCVRNIERLPDLLTVGEYGDGEKEEWRRAADGDKDTREDLPAITTRVCVQGHLNRIHSAAASMLWNFKPFIGE